MAEAEVIPIHDHPHAIRHHPDHRARARLRASSAVCSARRWARQETYPHLRVFDDVFSLTTGNYVEEVDVDRLMHGAMHGLAEALDADSAYLTAGADEARRSREPAAGPADVGLDLTRQYYLRVDRRARRARPPRRPGCGPATSSG